MKDTTYLKTGLHERPTEDALTCQRTCAFTATCYHFTYYTDSKGCWLLSADAKLREKGTLPSEVYAVSRPKDCQQKTMSANNSGFELHPDKQGHVTVAPNIEISPTGPRLSAQPH